MAVGSSRADGPEAIRRSFGTYTISNEEQPRLTITRDLDDFEFPNHAGAEVRVELVQDPKRGPVLEVIPCDGGGE